MPRFSIIITAYNRAELMRQAIDSARAQTFADREIIVVDDASTDGTAEVLRTYGADVRVVTLAANQGCEMAYRAGVAAAGGEYLAFLDSDDLLYPWALAVYDFIIDAHRQPALLVSRLVYFSTTAPMLRAPQTGDTFEFVRFKDYLSKDRTMASSLSMIVLRRDVYARSGGFRRSTATTFNMSDHNLLLEVGCDGPAILLEQPRTVAHRMHPDNATRNLPRVVAGMRRIIAAERKGTYPGGRRRRFERRVAIGGPVMHFVRRSLELGRVGLACRLFVSGFDMVLAKLARKVGTSWHGRVPAERIEWRPPARSAPPVGEQ